MRALRIIVKQSSANYRREETINNKMTYPLPPYSTVIGALHKACNYEEYHPMNLSIQGEYGGMKKEVYLDHCILNSLQNDRGILVKMYNADMISKGYVEVAKAKKSQGNDFRKGVTIDVLNQEYLDEYRNLKDLNDEISVFKKTRFNPLLEKIKARKKYLANKKKDSSLSKERLEFICKREAELKNIEKDIKKRLKNFELENYQEPIAKFKTLTTAPKYYEVLYDIKLIIHITAEEETLKAIYENIDNLTSIGRSEDFVDIVECEFTELEEIDEESDDEYESKYHAYISANVMNNSGIDLRRAHNKKTKGTQYLLNKDYRLSEDGKQRIFNKKLVSYVSKFKIYDPIDGVYIDRSPQNGEDYIVNLV